MSWPGTKESREGQSTAPGGFLRAEEGYGTSSPAFSPLGGYRVAPTDRMRGTRKPIRRSGREQPFLERTASVEFDPRGAEADIPRRNAWIAYLSKLGKATELASAEVMGRGRFASGRRGQELIKVLGDFCRGKAQPPITKTDVPPPMSRREVMARFRRVGESVTPMPSMGKHPDGLTLMAKPVGALHGVGTSPSAASSDRHSNYVDIDGLVKRRRRGRDQYGLGLHIGTMTTVQRVRPGS